MVTRIWQQSDNIILDPRTPQGLWFGLLSAGCCTARALTKARQKKFRCTAPETEYHWTLSTRLVIIFIAPFQLFLKTHVNISHQFLNYFIDMILMILNLGFLDCWTVRFSGFAPEVTLTFLFPPTGGISSRRIRMSKCLVVHDHWSTVNSRW